MWACLSPSSPRTLLPSPGKNAPSRPQRQDNMPPGNHEKRPADFSVGRLMFLVESPSLNLGCQNDHQSYLILGSVQDDVYDSVDVGDVDFAITVDVTAGILATIQDDVDGGIHVCNIDLTVAIHVARQGFRFRD